jgi:hypothetical protein
LTLDCRYGHRVLRIPDPRFIALQEFCDTRPDLLASPTVQLVKQTYEIAPGVLAEHGKTKNPWPNVDAASGCVLHHYGLTQLKVWRSNFSFSESEPIPFTVLHGHFGCLPRWVLVNRSFSPKNFPNPLQASDVCLSWSGPVVCLRVRFATWLFTSSLFLALGLPIERPKCKFQGYFRPVPYKLTRHPLQPTQSML